jgi:putative ABC transport system ATP-binding protein
LISTNIPMPAVVQLIDFRKTYRTGEIEVQAVRGVNLTIEKGEFVAIMGSSGSGKSTMMNTIGCLDRPTEGKCLIDGVETGSLGRNELAELRNRKLGFVFQGFNLLSRTTALENVELPMMYARPRPTASEQSKRATEALTLVGLGKRLDHTPSRLSGGQQQRVAIARALVNRPTLLLADEPTGNLDSRTSIEIMGIFQKLNDEGMTVVMVTHELDIAHYCKRIVVMRDGLVRSDAPVTARLNALEELQKLEAEQKAVQLNP